MAFLENGTFYSIEEYIAGMPRRVDESALIEDELHTLAIRLKSSKRKAVKMPVRTRSIEHRAGLAVVKFTFMDQDLKPTQDAEGIIREGIASNIRGAVIVDPATKDNFSIQQAYFKDYFEDQFGGMLAKGQEQDLLIPA